jgi:hypothetical protein
MPIPSGFEALDCQKAGREHAQLGNPDAPTRENESLITVTKVTQGHDDEGT